MDHPVLEAIRKVGTSSDYLKLRLNHQIILIALHQTHLVLPIAQLQTVPHQDVALEGLLNYHGRPVPVYHLSELIHESRPLYDLNTPLLMCTLSSGFIGLFISEVIELIHLSDKEIQYDHLDKAMPYVTGLLEEECSAWILDVEKLLQYHHTELGQSHV